MGVYVQESGNPKIYECPFILISIAFGIWYVYFQGSIFYQDGVDPREFIKAICNLFWILLPAMVLILPYTKYYYFVQLKTTGQKVRGISIMIITLLIRKLL